MAHWEGKRTRLSCMVGHDINVGEGVKETLDGRYRVQAEHPINGVQFGNPRSHSSVLHQLRSGLTGGGYRNAPFPFNNSSITSTSILPTSGYLSPSARFSHSSKTSKLYVKIDL